MENSIVSLVGKSSRSFVRSTRFTNRSVILAVCWVGFALYVLKEACKRERSKKKMRTQEEEGKEEEIEKAATVSSIFVYPIKSCRGISVSQAPLAPTGLRWDRLWLVVNSNGRAYTQRNEPKLALTVVKLPDEAFLEGWEPTANSYLVITAPGMKELKIPLAKIGEVIDGVSVWEWTGSALDEGQEAAKWFSDYLGKPSRLVRFNAVTETRVVDPEYARGHKTMFPDEYPFMLLSQGSLDALNSLLEEPIPVNRFRPNIFVDGCKPFSEDLWTDIMINKHTFQGVKLCARCKVPTIDQETGIAASEPNETLKKTRSDSVLRPSHKAKGKTYFGLNLVLKDPCIGGKGNVIKVGDPVRVLKMVSSANEAAA